MTFPILSYGAAAVGYGLLAALLSFSRQSEGEGRWLLAAVGGTALWAALLVAAVSFTGSPTPGIAYAVDGLRTLLWTLCLLRALPEAGWRGTRRVLSAAVLMFAALAAFVSALGGTYGPHVMLGASVIACLTIEQVFRNSTPEQQIVLRPFFWTLAAILGYDLFVFSDSVLTQIVDPNLWAGRGLFAAAAVPFLLVMAKRHPDWSRTLFISRQVVFYSATLSGAGFYLIAMAIVGTIIREQGGQWGAMVQAVFLIAAIAVLVVVLSSARLRAVARIFITKHFYRHQYEYRDEWLRLIRTLSAPSGELSLDQRSIKALADIVQSPGGQLWLDKGAKVYEPYGAWRTEFPSVDYKAASALARFLTAQGWVIDSVENDRDPERYNHAFINEPLPPNCFILPLFHRNELLGFARLIRPDGQRALNYEDHDLLKTAGRQVAAFLAHDLAMEQLAETRQFEAYNKLSAFVMHDLKNLLSQQTLLVENAKKHQHRPEFVSDVIKTIDSGVQRMRRLLRQLERTSSGSHEPRIELNNVVQEAVERSAKAGTVQPSFNGYRPLWVHAQADRLASVVGHLIANAQEATKPGGAIDVTVNQRDGRALIEVRDTGEGMSEEFVRRRLFKPFDTTKGSSGMGIGVYQTRELIRSLGGEMTVKSSVGVGTTVVIMLPLAQSPADRQVS